MRIVDEIIHPNYKITVFSHNNKFSLQIEADMLTQVYKFRETDTLRVGNEFRKLLDEAFFEKVELRFREMQLIQNDMILELEPPSDFEFPTVI